MNSSPPTPNLVRRIQRSRITISTIAIAPHGRGTQTLKDLARKAGGRFYLVKDPRKLPRIFVHEAQVVRKAILVEKHLTPILQRLTEPILGVAEGGVPHIAIRVDKGPKGGFSASKVEKTLNRDMARAEGVIESSLYVAGRKAGIPNRVLAELIRAYSWDVDFQRDIRSGDGFEVMYERVFDALGKQVFSGPIAFAALTLSGKRHAIYLHTTADGTRDYFDAKGRSARKALMRTPIDGARLSSGFGRRRHPVLGYNKLHRGVDFAAPRGTPIYAAGNGIIVRAGRNGAYGKYVRIRHNARYATAYAHMSGFARGLAKGKRVTQGQIIGFVGTTGRSTGPHLHYEILAGGVRTNPMKLRMPSGRKLKGAELARFQEARAGIERTYGGLKPEKVAQAAD